MERGHVNIGVPIDIPFTEITRMMEAQLVGKTFPLDKGGAFTATVKGVNVAASGGRLLISLRVKANEHKTWFGLGAEATVHVWGRPALDRRQQTLEVEDVSLDVQSEAAFGVLGVAARAALPFVERALTENASIDLKPIAENARKSIGPAIAEFQRSTQGRTRRRRCHRSPSRQYRVRFEDLARDRRGRWGGTHLDHGTAGAATSTRAVSRLPHAPPPASCDAAACGCGFPGLARFGGFCAAAWV